MADSKGVVYEFDDFRLAVDERLLSRSGTQISIPSRAFDLLVALVENNGHLVGKETLHGRVWANAIVEDANLTVQISALRKALGYEYIKTVIGHGYRFEANVRESNESDVVVETETFSRIKIEKEDFYEPQSLIDQRMNVVGSSGRSRSVVIALAAVVLVAIGFFIFNRVFVSNDEKASAATADKQTKIKRLTAKGTVGQASLSPDGRFFVYTVNERGTSRYSLWLGQTDGSTDVQLLPLADFFYASRSFSADGNWIYYTAAEPRNFNNATLYKMQTLGGVPQKLATGINAYPVLSPDEKQIGYVRTSTDDKTTTLVTANLDGSGVREITVRPPEQAFVVYSLAWSPDGKTIAFGAKDAGSEEIFSANIETQEIKQITELDWTRVTKLAWLSDGKGLVAVARDKDSFFSNQIWRVDHESGKAQKIVNDLLHYGTILSLSADSNALIASQALVESNIWIAKSDNLAEARQITFGSAELAGWFGLDWTPDGKVVYVGQVDRSLTLWIADASGENPKQITPIGFLDIRPTATADGKYIVFESNRSGKAEIWRVQRDGTDLRQLTFNGKNSEPHSSPDGKTVVYSHSSGGAASAWRVSIEGGEALQISTVDCSHGRVSPDGKSIACGSRVLGKAKLIIVSIENGETLRSFDVTTTHNFNGSIRWSRDGDFISYRDWENGIWSQPVSGGEPKRLDGLPQEKLYTYDWSPGGEQLAFTRGRSMTDAVLITDFK